MISELSPDRISSIGKSFNYIALFVFDGKLTPPHKETIKSIAKSNLSSNPRDFIFLYFNEKQNKRWLSNYEIEGKPTLIVFTSSALDLYYYNKNITSLDQVAMTNFLLDVKNGKATLLYTDVLNYYLTRVNDFAEEYLLLICAAGLAVPIACYYLCCKAPKTKNE